MRRERQGSRRYPLLGLTDYSKNSGRLQTVAPVMQAFASQRATLGDSVQTSLFSLATLLIAAHERDETVVVRTAHLAGPAFVLRREQLLCMAIGSDQPERHAVI